MECSATLEDMRLRAFAFCLLTSTFLHSAGPILHLWTAERFCEIYGITDEETLREIIVGTELPDIRYITHQPRKFTHPDVQDLSDVCASKTPFELGMKLHVWLDQARESFIPKEVYDAVAPHAEGFSATLLKFIEEEILADFYDGRRWSCYFDQTFPTELLFADEASVRKWHTTIQWTMSARPSWLLWAQSYRGPAFGVSASTLYNWSYLLPKQAKNPLFQDYMRALLAHIEEHLNHSRDDRCPSGCLSCQN